MNRMGKKAWWEVLSKWSRFTPIMSLDPASLTPFLSIASAFPLFLLPPPQSLWEERWWTQMCVQMDTTQRVKKQRHGAPREGAHLMQREGAFSLSVQNQWKLPKSTISLPWVGWGGRLSFSEIYVKRILNKREKAELAEWICLNNPHFSGLSNLSSKESFAKNLISYLSFYWMLENKGSKRYRDEDETH